MQVCHAETVTEIRASLIWLEDHIRQPVRGDLLLDPPKTVSATDEQKHDVGPVAQGAGGSHYSLEVVATAQIAGIGDDKFSSEIPALPQGIRLGRYGLNGAPVGPVMNDCDPILCDAACAEIVGHLASDGDVHSCAG